MPIKADYHMHSSFSGDSTAPMENMIQRGIELGLDTLCFTEHMDMEFTCNEECPPGKFEVNTDSYLYELIKCRDKYADRINIRFGVELGLQPHLKKELAAYARSFDFDFIIGSSHLAEKRDPCYPSFYEGRSEEESYRAYFRSIIDSTKVFSNFDVYGHLDYIVRYGPNTDREYSYDKYADLFDSLLTLLIEMERGIEINTGGLRKGLRDANPCADVIRRYRELGGEIITVGSDAHVPQDIAADFNRAADILKTCGFHYYTVFENRLPEFRKL